MERFMSRFSIGTLAVLISLGLVGQAKADAKDALAAGAQIVAMTTLPDGRIAITLQKDKAATICVLKLGVVAETDACYTVR
jgi:hypothetical protein